MILNILNPEILILEDLDHFYGGGNNADLLEKLESFNKSKKIILATANAVKNLGAALIRPGRFDELIEIKQGEEEIIESMIDRSLPIYEEIKTMPLAFVDEVSKRIKISGVDNLMIEDIRARAKTYAGDTYKI